MSIKTVWSALKRTLSSPSKLNANLPEQSTLVANEALKHLSDINANVSQNNATNQDQDAIHQSHNQKVEAIYDESNLYEHYSIQAKDKGDDDLALVCEARARQLINQILDIENALIAQTYNQSAAPAEKSIHTPETSDIPTKTEIDARLKAAGILNNATKASTESA